MRTPERSFASGALSQPPGTSTFTWQRIFLFLTASLASTVLLKISAIQYLEILYFVQIIVLFFAFQRRGWRVSLSKPLWSLSLLYLTILLLSLLLALWALTRDFYLAADLSLLKFPLVITLSRASELLVSVCALMYLAHLFRKEENKAAFTMRVYFRAGVISAAYAMLTYPLARMNLLYLGTAPDYRMRGFYNEGGPYGLYLVSVILVGFSLYRLRWEKRNWLSWSVPLIACAFLGSQSKAAVMALIVIGLSNLLLLRSAMQRAAVLGGIVAVIFIVSQVVDVAAGVRLYRRAGLAYERASYLHKGDANFVLGRIAGAFLVPRMISEHPLTGIGWGNYGLVRNAPEYRGASAWTDFNDDPGLGLFGLSAELGLPLTALLTVSLLFPAAYLWRQRAPLWLLNLAILQPVVHLFGAQLNLTYPWVVTAFALGLGLQQEQRLGRAEVRISSTPSVLTQGI